MKNLGRIASHPKLKTVREGRGLALLARDGYTFLDIGGFVGDMSHYFLERKPGNKVIIFEPVKRSYNFICHRFAKDRRVTVINKAVCDRTGVARFYTRLNRPACSTLMAARRGSRDDIVDTICLDDWMVDTNVDNIDTIKLDVEGAEHLILKGGRKLIERVKPTIHMEYHGGNYDAILNELEYLFDLGYYRYPLPKAHAHICLYHNRFPLYAAINSHLNAYVHLVKPVSFL